MFRIVADLRLAIGVGVDIPAAEDLGQAAGVVLVEAEPQGVGDHASNFTLVQAPLGR